MAELELEKKKQESKPVEKEEDILDKLYNIKIEPEEEKDVNELIYDCYGIIDQMKEHKEDQLSLLKQFLIDYKNILKKLKKIDEKSYNMEKLEEFLKENDEKINLLISDYDKEKDISSILNTIISETEKAYFTFINTNKDNKSREIDKSEEEFINSENYSIEAIDNMYKKLYDSINKKDIKKITQYRGKLIRLLKKYRKEIDNAYNEIEGLEKLGKIFADTKIDTEKIREILQNKENEKYLQYFEEVINNPEKLIKKFKQIYIQKSVRKKVLYKEALELELKEHKRVLNERYEKEFLDKKATLSTIVTVLPKAVALSIRKVATAISELKEAKTNRSKAVKFFEMLKSIGIATVTPAIYAGKFVVNNWYALYSVLRGMTEVNQIRELQAKQKEQIELQNEKQKEESKEKNVDTKTEEKTNVDVETNVEKEEKTKVDVDGEKSVNENSQVNPDAHVEEKVDSNTEKSPETAKQTAPSSSESSSESSTLSASEDPIKVIVLPDYSGFTYKSEPGFYHIINDINESLNIPIRIKGLSETYSNDSAQTSLQDEPKSRGGDF